MSIDWLGGSFHGALDEACAHVRMGKARIVVVSSGLWDFYMRTCIGISGHVFYSRAHWMSCVAIGSDSGLCQLPRTQSRWVNCSYSPKHSYVMLPFSIKESGGKAVYLCIFAHSLVRLECFTVTFVLLNIRGIKITGWHSNTICLVWFLFCLGV